MLANRFAFLKMELQKKKKSSKLSPNGYNQIKNTGLDFTLNPGCSTTETYSATKKYKCELEIKLKSHKGKFVGPGSLAFHQQIKPVQHGLAWDWVQYFPL